MPCKSSKNGCLLSVKALYNYLTFYQFKEVQEMRCLFTSKQFGRFFVMLLITLIYYLVVFGILLTIIRSLSISFSGGTGRRACKKINIWETLTPRLSDLWKQC